MPVGTSTASLGCRISSIDSGELRCIKWYNHYNDCINEISENLGQSGYKKAMFLAASETPHLKEWFTLNLCSMRISIIYEILDLIYFVTLKRKYIQPWTKYFYLLQPKVLSNSTR